VGGERRGSLDRRSEHDEQRREDQPSPEEPHQVIIGRKLSR
jgi:hypothetical protein